MKINHLINKMKQAQIQLLMENEFNSLNSKENKSGIDNNISSPHPYQSGNYRLNQSLFNKINIPQLKNMDSSLQKNIIQTWTDLNLPLKKKYILQLIKYLNQYTPVNTGSNYSSSDTSLAPDSGSSLPPVSPSLKPEIVIKSFANLLKNGILPSSRLIKGLSLNLDPNYSLSQELALPETSENLQEHSQLPSSSKFAQIKNKLSLNLSQNPGEIAQKLSSYSDSLREVIQLLTNSQDRKSQNIMNYLLGQQVINHQETAQEYNLLFSLELPLFSSTEAEPIPLYLQVRREQKQENQASSSKPDPHPTETQNYRIKFILEMEQLGQITADINLNSDKINCNFTTNKNSTRTLIKNHFHLLQEKLNEIGFQVNSLNIEKKNPETMLENFPDPLKEMKTARENNKEEYTHIDFKI